MLGSCGSSLWLSLLLLQPSCSLELRRNVTLDDDHSSIIYYGAWEVSEGSSLYEYGGNHHLTDSSTASALVTFTGVAVYLLSPLWPYSVAVEVTLDDQPPVVVDLRDYTVPFNPLEGTETVPSTARWGMTDLQNTQHTVAIRLPRTNGRYAVVDGVAYTILERQEFPPTPVSSFSASTRPRPSTSPTAARSVADSQTNKTAVILGAVFGSIVLLALVAIVFLLRRSSIMACIPLLGIPKKRKSKQSRDLEGLLAPQAEFRNAPANRRIKREYSTQAESPVVRAAPRIYQLHTKPLPRSPIATSPRLDTRDLPVSGKSATALTAKKSITATVSSHSSFFPTPIDESDRRSMGKSPKLDAVSSSGEKRRTQIPPKIPDFDFASTSQKPIDLPINSVLSPGANARPNPGPLMNGLGGTPSGHTKPYPPPIQTVNIATNTGLGTPTPLTTPLTPARRPFGSTPAANRGLLDPIVEDSESGISAASKARRRRSRSSPITDQRRRSTSRHKQQLQERQLRSRQRYTRRDIPVGPRQQSPKAPQILLPEIRIRTSMPMTISSSSSPSTSSATMAEVAALFPLPPAHDLGLLAAPPFRSRPRATLRPLPRQPDSFQSSNPIDLDVLPDSARILGTSGDVDFTHPFSPKMITGQGSRRPLPILPPISPRTKAEPIPRIPAPSSSVGSIRRVAAPLPLPPLGSPLADFGPPALQSAPVISHTSRIFSAPLNNPPPTRRPSLPLPSVPSTPSPVLKAIKPRRSPRKFAQRTPFSQEPGPQPPPPPLDPDTLTPLRSTGTRPLSIVKRGPSVRTLPPLPSPTPSQSVKQTPPTPSLMWAGSGGDDASSFASISAEGQIIPTPPSSIGIDVGEPFPTVTMSTPRTPTSEPLVLLNLSPPTPPPKSPRRQNEVGTSSHKERTKSALWKVDSPPR